jgi:hypothetical protein
MENYKALCGLVPHLDEHEFDKLRETEENVRYLEDHFDLLVKAQG